MIGMSQIKKKTIQGVAIGLAIGVVGVGLSLWWGIATVKSYENGTNKKYLQLYTKNVAVLNRDVIQGEVITEDMLTEVNVHNRTAPNGTGTISDFVGKVAKYNIVANAALTDNMVTDEIVSADIRDQEVNTVLMPSDLVEGDYVDIRIMYPNGTDYIVLAQKQVSKIVSSTMWLQLAEDERLLLNSAIVDSFLNKGTKLYATKYSQSDAQIKISDEASSTAKGYVQEEIKKQLDTLKTADENTATDIVFDLVEKYKNYASTMTRTIENYQPNAQVMSMMQSNQNVLQEAKNKLSAEARANIENSINTYKDNNEEDYNNVISGAEQSISDQQTQREEILNESLAQ